MKVESLHGDSSPARAEIPAGAAAVCLGNQYLAGFRLAGFTYDKGSWCGHWEKTNRSTPVAPACYAAIRVSSLVAPLAAKQGGPSQPDAHGHHSCRFRDCDRGDGR